MNSLKPKRYLIHYFTGTGNTAHAADVMARHFENAGSSVRLHAVTCDAAPPLGGYDCHVFLFPVYAFTVPFKMQQYLKHLPRVDRVPAAVIANHGMLSMRGGWHTGYESQAPALAARLLRRRGFDVHTTDRVGYPANVTIAMDPPAADDCREIFESADQRVRQIADRIAQGETGLRRYTILDVLLAWIVGGLFIYWGRWHIGKFFAADRACNGCNLCVKACPAQAINLRNKKPTWNYRCEACLRCFNICPKQSIQFSLVRLITYAVVSLATLVGLGLSAGRLQTAIVGPAHPILLGVLYLLLTIAGYAVVTSAVLYGADKFFAVLEQSPFFRSIIAASYTRRIRRYTAPGFDPQRGPD